MNTKVKLSQCMIVKNEEKNIEQALSWAKEVAFEQIVVDTGSTDNTVEIARRMGAKIYHFSWIDDFSAAKNFAIEKASGNWIAFLDADEYFLDADVKKLMKILDTLENNPSARQNIPSVMCAWSHLNDQGIPFSTGAKIRIFKNRKDLRYHHRIHEQLLLDSGQELSAFNAIDILTIQHTGYSHQAFTDTRKAERNIELLRKELQAAPDNQETSEYLAEALFGCGQKEEAEKLLIHMLSQPQGNTIHRQDSAYYFLMRILTDRDQASDVPQIKHFYQQFKQTESLYPDIDYLVGKWYGSNQKWEEAICSLEQALEKQKLYSGFDSVHIANELEIVYYILAIAYQERRDNRNAVKYCTLALHMMPYSEQVLIPLLSILREDANTSTQDIMGFLNKLYDMHQMKQKLFIYKCAKKISFYELEDLIYDSFSEEERAWFDQEDTTPDMSSDSGIACNNMTDRDFSSLINEIKTSELSALCQQSIENLNKFKLEHETAYSNLIHLYNQYASWGNLVPERQIYEAFERRISMLAAHTEDILWLYNKLEDYRSRRVLLAILRNWIYLDCEMLFSVRDYTAQYFDFDFISSGSNQIVADVGSRTGNTIKSFVESFGSTYQHYYCYETESRAAEALRRNTRKYKNITIFEKLASIDDDIKEALTFIKINFEADAEAVIKNGQRQIKENHPILAVSLHYNADDIWRLPRQIYDMLPEYQLYLRYYGSNLAPTEIVLYAEKRN